MYIKIISNEIVKYSHITWDIIWFYLIEEVNCRKE